jgi:hypothetical protein
MFTHTDCMVLLTKAPAFNRAVITFAPLLGWKFEFERKEIWPTESGPVDMSYFSFPYDKWVRTAPDLVATGRAFHARLDEEFARHRALHETQPDEECHDRYVGACAEMIYGGQPEKAVVLYNRFARLAGYAPISMVSRAPLLINIGSALLMFDGDNFKAIQVRSGQSNPWPLREETDA